MIRWLAMAGTVGAVGCTAVETPVGATLDDGQILVGGITTPSLRLEGAFGEVDLPLEDVGMMLPVEGTTLADSHGHVTVWLRNGSELKGKWAGPELSMAIRVGGRDQSVSVPTDRLQSIQLRGSEAWPSTDLFRVRTSWGDDFLIDPEQTRLTVDSALGRFEVTLAECLSVGPVGAPTGDWRMVLASGSVLIGAPGESELVFVLPMGPERIVVPLTALVSLERGGWSEAPMPEYAAPAPVVSVGSGMESALPELKSLQAKPGLSRSQGWFDNDQLENAKR